MFGKRLRRTRALVRRALASALPPPVVESAHALYLGKWWLRRAGEYGEPDLIVARALLRPGDVAVDGGANFGRYADAFAAAVGDKGRVLAIEPVPRSARLLRRVMHYRRRRTVDVLQAALAAAPGMGHIVIPANAAGDTNFFRAHLSEEAEPNGVDVALETLDRAVAGLPSTPALVKLDLEGHERAALAGAPTLLASRTAWLLEMNDDPDLEGSDADAIETLMAEHGYAPWVYDPDARRLLPRRPGPRVPNVFFLQPHHLERVRDAGVAVEGVS